MSKYIKKPVVIEAEQYFNGKEIDGLISYGHPRFPSAFNTGFGLFPTEGDEVFIETLEGFHLVSEGDWVITGVHGEKYPCKPDIFEETYDLYVAEDK
jgi:hypothetical protein